VKYGRSMKKITLNIKINDGRKYMSMEMKKEIGK
jgi:hypothetical protein